MSSSLWPEKAIVEVDSVTSLLSLLARGKLSRYTMVWRGVANISWELDSGLFRRLASNAGRAAVTESVLRAAEMELLGEARRLRFDRARADGRLNSLELLATLQHQGAATRLVDVTLNALIGAWFVVEDETQLANDGALFGIDMTGRALSAELAESEKALEDSISHAGMWLWRPPPLEQRIRAQQAAFLFSAVPDAPPASTSLDLKFPALKADRLFQAAPGPGRYAKRAVVVFRIPSEVKLHLRDFLTGRLGYDAETLYPDLAGFARARRA